MIDLDLILLVGSVVVIVAILSARLGTRFGLPALLLFLGVGMLLGETRVNFDNPELAHALGFGATASVFYGLRGEVHARDVAEAAGGGDGGVAAAGCHV